MSRTIFLLALAAALMAFAFGYCAGRGDQMAERYFVEVVR